MCKKSILLLAIIASILVGSQICNAMTYFLQQDLGIRGNMRYCKYSNGKIYSVNATDLCEMQIEEGGVPTQRGTMGFYLGEYQDGMTKVCIYNVLGNKRAVRLNSYEVCPPSAEF